MLRIQSPESPICKLKKISWFFFYILFTCRIFLVCLEQKKKKNPTTQTVPDPPFSLNTYLILKP